MSEPHTSCALATYVNPVYPRSFPDPFVLKFQDAYFAYCTDYAEDGNVFGVLRSRDLVNWTPLGGAMRPLDPSPPFYWAPEVTYENGKFYLYYSAGPETTMEIRVAVSERPDGGFIDSGHRLTKEDFAIDAHVFIDDDGTKYLFYATDFLDHEYIGTGTVVDRMLDWFTLEGLPRPVTRAKYDWQVYDPNRKEKGDVRWHTVEGPTVFKRKGVYYEMFSGGNWQNTTYGVSFAISHRLDNQKEWTQSSDGEQVLPILRTEPGVILGPGHNSVVRGPNNRELFCVYHRWTENRRVLAIDRMDFAGERIFVIGATHTPQPAPLTPQIQGITAEDDRWTNDGEWTFENGQAAGGGELKLTAVPPSFLCEVTVQCNDLSNVEGSFGIRFDSQRGPVDLILLPELSLVGGPIENISGAPAIQKLPSDFDWAAGHLLRIELDHRKLKIRLDGLFNINTFLSGPASAFSLWSESAPIKIAAFQLTGGFEELFEDIGLLIDNGWRISPDSNHRVECGELLFETDAECLLEKGPLLKSFEFAANFRSINDLNRGSFGLDLYAPSGDRVFRLAVDCLASVIDVNGSPYAIPGGVKLSDHHQLRLLKLGKLALCYFDDMLLGEYEVLDSELSSRIQGIGGPFAVEMVRQTAI